MYSSLLFTSQTTAFAGSISTSEHTLHSSPPYSSTELTSYSAPALQPTECTALLTYTLFAPQGMPELTGYQQSCGSGSSQKFKQASDHLCMQPEHQHTQLENARGLKMAANWTASIHLLCTSLHTLQ